MALLNCADRHLVAIVGVGRETVIYLQRHDVAVSEKIGLPILSVKMRPDWGFCGTLQVGGRPDQELSRGRQAHEIL